MKGEGAPKQYHITYQCRSSCGCFHSEQIANRNRKHDSSYSRIYTIWDKMKRRCCNPTDPAYKDYGGRGITVCDEWLNSFVSFREWANENGYSKDLSIDRIDVNGNYCPENCRWADAKTQCNNRRNNHNITFNGETRTIAEWSRVTGIPQDVISYRVKSGWGTERALTEKVRARHR